MESCWCAVDARRGFDAVHTRLGGPFEERDDDAMGSEGRGGGETGEA